MSFNEKQTEVCQKLLPWNTGSLSSARKQIETAFMDTRLREGGFFIYDRYTVTRMSSGRFWARVTERRK